MIKAIGIDSIEIERFSLWQTYSEQKLSKIFLPHEIEYCLSNTTKSAERFAIRFAAKEAFFKAASAAHLKKDLYLLTICKNVSIVHADRGIPQLLINWNALELYDEKLTVHISLTHTKIIATAFVILEQ